MIRLLLIVIFVYLTYLFHQEREALSQLLEHNLICTFPREHFPTPPVFKIIHTHQNNEYVNIHIHMHIHNTYLVLSIGYIRTLRHEG